MGFHRARVYYAQKTNANLIDVVIQDSVDCKGLTYCMVHASSLINLGLLIPSILKDLIVIVPINKKPIETSGNTSLVDVQTLCSDLVYDFNAHTESSTHKVITDCSPLDSNTKEQPKPDEELLNIDLTLPDPLTFTNIPQVLSRLQGYLDKFTLIERKIQHLSDDILMYITKSLSGIKPDNYDTILAAKREYYRKYEEIHTYPITKEMVKIVFDDLTLRREEIIQQQENENMEESASEEEAEIATFNSRREKPKFKEGREKWRKRQATDRRKAGQQRQQREREKTAANNRNNDDEGGTIFQIENSQGETFA
jgi:hypothetical protein